MGLACARWGGEVLPRGLRGADGEREPSQAAPLRLLEVIII